MAKESKVSMVTEFAAAEILQKAFLNECSIMVKS
jgi:hypothetical protein